MRKKEKKRKKPSARPFSPRRYLESRGYLSTKLLACGKELLLITVYFHPNVWTNKLRITGFEPHFDWFGNTFVRLAKTITHVFRLNTKKVWFYPVIFFSRTDRALN